MSLVLTILGLGFNEEQWLLLSPIFQAQLQDRGARCQFRLLSKDSDNFVSSSLNELVETSPDVVITSSSFFNNIEECTNLIQQYQEKIAGIGFVFLVENNLNQFLEKIITFKIPIIANYPFSFKGAISIQDEDFLAFEEKDVVMQKAIDPSPIFSFKNRETAEKEFFLFDELKSVKWDRGTYQPQQFYLKISKEYSTAKLNVGCIKKDEQYHLCSGVSLHEIEELKVGAASFQHIFSYEHVSQGQKNFHRVVDKIYSLYEKKEQELIVLKSVNSNIRILFHIPIQIIGTVSLVLQVIQRGLNYIGFNNVTCSFEKKPLKHSIIVQASPDVPVSGKHIFSIFDEIDQGLDQLGVREKLADFQFRKVDFKNLPDIYEVRRELATKQNQITRIEQQGKKNTLLEKLSKHDQSITEKNLQKIKIIDTLFQRAVLWEDLEVYDEEVQAKTVLTLTHEKEIASKINRSLSTIEQKLWLDLNIFNSLETLSQYRLENFLEYQHRELIIIGKQDRNELVRKISILTEKSEDDLAALVKKAPEPISLDEVVELEESALDVLFQGMCKNVFSVIEPLKEPLLYAAKEIFTTVEEERFIAEKFKKIGIFSSQKNVMKNLVESLDQVFPNLEKSLVRRNFLSIQLKENFTKKEQKLLEQKLPEGQSLAEAYAQELAEQNVPKIHSFLKTAKKQLQSFDVDCLLLEHDAQLSYLLVKSLHEKESKHKKTPIVVLIKGKIQKNYLEYFVMKGVKVLPQRKFITMKKEEWAEELKKAFIYSKEELSLPEDKVEDTSTTQEEK